MACPFTFEHMTLCMYNCHFWFSILGKYNNLFYIFEVFVAPKLKAPHRPGTLGRLPTLPTIKAGSDYVYT